MSFIYRVTLNWLNTTTSLFGQNVLHFADDSEALSVQAIGDSIDRWWWGGDKITQGEMRDFTSTNVRLDGMTIQRVSPAPALGGVPYTGLLAPGRSGGVVKHAVLGLCFTLQDGGAGPRHRGRVYHYGVEATKVTDSGPTAGNVTGTMGQWATNMIARFGPTGTQPLRLKLFHRDLQGADRFTQVTNIRINPRLVVQRRRNFGVGI